MRKISVALAAILILVTTVFSATVVVPEKVSVKKGRMARIVATTSGVDVKVVNLFEEDVDIFREYDSDAKKYVFRVTADKAGKYKLGFITSDKDGTADPAYCVVEVIGDPGPVPPTPKPDPPGPKPDPKPGPIAKAWVIIIEDTANPIESRGQLFTNKGLSDYLKGKGWTWKVVSTKTVDKDGNPPKDMKPYIDRASGKKLPQLFVADQDGNVLFEGDLPPDADELLKKLKSIGG